VYPDAGIRRPAEPLTEIPADKFEYALRLLTPEENEPNINDVITPLIAEVILTHDGPVNTRILVRDSGKSPALVTLDGRHYFYARSDEDTQAGAIQLIRLVRMVRERAAAGRR
jgi:hypothetical protein